MDEYHEIFSRNSPSAYRLNKYSKQEEVLEGAKDLIFDCVIYGLTPLAARLAYALGYVNKRILLCFSSIARTFPELRPVDQSQPVKFNSAFFKKTRFLRADLSLSELSTDSLSIRQSFAQESVFTEREGYTLDFLLTAMNEGVNVLKIEKILSYEPRNNLARVCVSVAGKTHYIYSKIFVSAEPSSVAQDSFFLFLPYVEVPYIEGFGVVQGLNFFLVQDQLCATLYSDHIVSERKAIYFPPSKKITKIGQHLILNSDNLDLVCRSVFEIPYSEPCSTLLGSRELFISQSNNGLQLMKLMNSCGLSLQ